MPLQLPRVSLAWVSCPLGRGRVLGGRRMCPSWQALTCEVVGSGGGWAGRQVLCPLGDNELETC